MPWDFNRETDPTTSIGAKLQEVRPAWALPDGDHGFESALPVDNSEDNVNDKNDPFWTPEYDDAEDRPDTPSDHIAAVTLFESEASAEEEIEEKVEPRMTLSQAREKELEQQRLRQQGKENRIFVEIPRRRVQLDKFDN